MYLSNLNDTLRRVFLVFFHYFEYIVSLPYGLQSSSWEWGDSLMVVSLYTATVFFLPLLKFSLHLLFVILIVMYLVVDLFGFILFQIPCAFWLQIFVFFFSRLGKFSTTIFLKINSVSLFLSSLSRIPIIQMLVYSCLRNLLNYPPFQIFFFFFLFSLGDFHYSISNSLIHLFVLSNLLFIPFMYF